eukprot:5042396-Amphidinium_carterae.1
MDVTSRCRGKRFASHSFGVSQDVTPWRQDHVLTSELLVCKWCFGRHRAVDCPEAKSKVGAAASGSRPGAVSIENSATRGK